MALDGGRAQFLGSEKVRHILEQLPHVGQTFVARLEKNGHTTTYPKVYSRAKMPLISAFRRGRNGDPHEFEANTEVQRTLPASPNSRICHGTSGRTARKLTRTESRSQREIPSATPLWIPRTCRASKCDPDDTSSTPRSHIRAPDRGSSPPRQRRTHSTAASLSPRNETQSPLADGRSAQNHENPRRNNHAQQLEHVDR